MRAKLFVTEALRSISTNISTTVAATLTVLIGMFLLGLFIALGSWVVSWTDHVKKELLVKVYFDDAAGPNEINAVGDKLKVIDEVDRISFVSKDEALAIMKKRAPELTRNLATNPLPASWEVTPKSADDIEGIVAEIRSANLAGVNEIKYGKEKSERIRKVAGIIELVFLGASIILLIASTMLIANTIRLSIFSRRREIEVMKLVGATNWFVRGPFMLEGLICGLLGSVSAVVLLFVGKEFALPQILGRVDAGADVKAWSFSLIALVLVGVGLLLGAAGSGITIRRFLKI